MKKKRINLIINREEYTKFEKIFLYIRSISYVFLVVFFIVIIYFFILINNLNKKIELLTLEKTSILKSINFNVEKYAKLNYLKNKYSDLEEFMKEDANSSPYYSLLNGALKDTSNSAKIKIFNIDKNRNVEFTVTFSNFTSMRNFFKFLESENFLKKFEKIFLKNFSVIGATIDNSENYELSFYGVFLPYNKIIQ